jgi:hypothetical protein
MGLMNNPILNSVPEIEVIEEIDLALDLNCDEVFYVLENTSNSINILATGGIPPKGAIKFIREFPEILSVVVRM